MRGSASAFSPQALTSQSERPSDTSHSHIARATDAADRTILVLGSPRSGTTWLAKILDSHPDVVYRHEPDEVRAPVPGSDPRWQLHTWINERSLRVAAKPPYFRKSWLPEPLALLRSGIAQALKGAAHLPGGGSWFTRMGVPDLVSVANDQRLRVVLKLVNWNAAGVLRALPSCRCLFILRHPCGQVASAMTGAAQRHFGRRGDGVLAPEDETFTTVYAARHGVDPNGFRALRPALQHAWCWLAFNEPALAELDHLPNARLVLYEELCAAPEAVARNLFDFVGLPWHAQTSEFVARSTQHDGAADYFNVFRSSEVVSQQWRTTMDPADQEAVRTVIRQSPLARHWHDLRG